MRNDRLFDALVDENTVPAEPAGGGISADDLQAFEKRIVESVNTKLDERLKEINKVATAPVEPETTETATADNKESEE